MTDTPSDPIALPRPFRPDHFPEIYQHLRLRAQLTIKELSYRTGYSAGIITAYEERTLSPSMKSMLRYCKALHLFMELDEKGLTIIDAETHEVIVEHWTF